MALNAMPSREEFMTRLGADLAPAERDAVCYKDIGALAEVQAQMVAIIGRLLDEMDLERASSQ